MNSVEREEVFKAFKKFEADGYPIGYSKPKRYWVRNPETGKLYPQKAIFGIANRLTHKDCGSATITRRALEKAGFEIVDTNGTIPPTITEACDQIPTGREGAAIQVTSNRYERDPALRQACVAHFIALDGRLACQVCGMDFESRYGEIGHGFIHIHHLDPLGNGRGVRKIDPIKDLIPVCPNCHAMLHKKPGKGVFEPEELRKRLKNR